MWIIRRLLVSPTDGVMMWSSSAGLQTRDGRPRSAQVEMASYVLLAFIRRGYSEQGIMLMKWLTRQRNHLGGYGTTQVTVQFNLIRLDAILGLGSGRRERAECAKGTHPLRRSRPVSAELKAGPR